MNDPGFGVYVHWPYCGTICPYCDFNVHRARGAEAAPLLDAIVRDATTQAARIGRRTVDTLFLGGGTPSLLSGDEIANLMASLRNIFAFAPGAEISLEANPEDAARFAEQAAAGINRFSIGMQSLNDEALTALGRRHNAADARAAVEAAARTGARVSLDLIYAREGQGIADWSRELRDALALPIEHVSLYQLTIEQGTAFDRAVARGTLRPPSSDEAASLYEATQEICEAAGFPAYEISNHARGAAAQSRHNLLYWRGGEWLGLGPGAHGRVNRSGARFATEARRLPADYIADANAETEHATALTPDECVQEALLMGLRLSEGLTRSRLASHPPSEPRIAAFVEDGFLTATPERLTLTPRGRLFADRIAAELAS